MLKLLKISLLIGSMFFLFLSGKSKNITEKNEAKNAFEYLNKVRGNPKVYGKQLGINLRKVKPQPALIWNDTLARVAEEKANDMALKEYFSHTNKKGQGINILIHKAGYSLPKYYLKKKKDNFFESIAMGSENGVDVINDLIIDKGINPPLHRQHLLGMTDFWEDCVDIGIGFVKTNNPARPTYVCIIIAKHK